MSFLNEIDEYLDEREKVILSAQFAKDLVAFRKAHPLSEIMIVSVHASDRPCTGNIVRNTLQHDGDTCPSHESTDDLWADCTGMDESKIKGLS